MLNSLAQCCFVAVLTIGQTLSESPGSGKPTSATSYSVYHRKFEPKDGPSKSVHYSTKIGPKFSSKTSHPPPGPGLKKGPKYASKESFLDRPSFQENLGKNKGGFVNENPSNFNDGPPPASDFNDGPLYNNDAQSNYNSGEVPYNQRQGTNFDAPNSYNGNDVPYSPPYPNDAPPPPPPVHNDAPIYTPDSPYNGPGGYVPPPPPADLPHYDSGPAVFPQHQHFDYPAPPVPQFHASQPSYQPAYQPSFQPNYQSNFQTNFPINIPNVQSHYSLNIPSIQQPNYPINIPSVQQSHYPVNIPGVQQSHFPVNIPGIQQSHFPQVNIPKPSFQIPYVNSPGVQYPGQFNSYQFDSGSHNFPAPPKIFSPVQYQQPIYQGSSQVQTIAKPSNKNKKTSSDSNFN
ncbi:Hypothetical protein NTJ_13930 [Nesidiocoris tenuis]|uniref:Uncharacterized protein n=1 Tax=Nesidiocoris tenuis TaxID=355587 RepID=A0ABN7B9R0_9HEMI|nr:Hypothetical protein NTJ_13930 [Nesidiocoris tenuis]